MTTLRPGEFCRLALKAQEAADGLRRRRKRDQRPDQIGLALKADLLTLAAEADPEPERFEAWLMQQVLSAPAAGSVRAVARLILDEYRFAAIDPGLSEWLRQGAPSDDARPRHRPDEQFLECTCSAHHLFARDT